MTTLQKLKSKRQKDILNTSLKSLVLAMSTVTIMPLAQADVANKGIGDLEIYKPAEGGKVTITMMLDTSGSMDGANSQANVALEACDFPASAGVTSHTTSVERSNTTPSYNRVICHGGGYSNPDRITRLKDAIFDLMDKGEIDYNKVAIGIGNFSTNSGANNAYTRPDSYTGKMLVPAAILTPEQRLKIKTAVANLRVGGATPSASAYAEVASYMLGTNTSSPINVNEEHYLVQLWQGKEYFYPCTEKVGPVCTNNGGQDTSINSGNYSSLGYSKGPCARYGSEYQCLTKPKSMSFSGYPNSHPTTKTSDGRNYNSPLPTNAAQCDGQGIYFLTDGEPNGYLNTDQVMRRALGSKGAAFNVPTAQGNGTLLNDGAYKRNNGWLSIGQFSKALRDASTNPKNTSIRTAVVGFGSVFDTSQYNNIIQELDKLELDKNTSLPIANKFKSGEKGKYFNCSLITTPDAKNACNWGAKSHPNLPNVGGFGEGGFYSAQSTQDVVNSVKTFLGDLSNTIDPVPAGVIVIPNDPYSLSNKQAIAYYPTVEAKVSDASAIWPGNMKKYALKDATLYGKSNVALFKDKSGELNPQAQDLWSDKDYGENNQIIAGGFYAQLKTPASGLGTNRKLYIQDEGQLKVFGVNSSGKVTVNNSQITTTSLKDAVYTQDVKKRLLNFLGFTDLPAGNVENMTLSAPKDAIKVLGASIHSSPAVVSHGANLDDNGRVTDDRPNDFVLFGSMDGALHLVKASNHGQNNGGQEEFAFIPKEMLSNPQNLQGLSVTGTGKAVGVPNFGIDAPWLVATDYKYDFSAKKVNVDATDGIGMYAYGGLRMGGKAFYGLNLTNINTPTFAFEITPATTNFARMGQIWSKPVRAKIRNSSTDTKGTDVLVFGGGYDACYENEKFQVGVTDATLGACSGKTEAEGNALYIINAKTGDLIWSASSTTGTTKHADLKHSIVGEVNVLDRDNDGFMDHVYFADLGGQVFRADFKNAGMKIGANETTNFSNARIVKLLANASTGDDQKYNRRFYEKPVVSVYRNEISNKLFAMVNVISGDRSSPLSKYRQDEEKADRVYGLMDFDVALPLKTFYSDTFTGSFGTGVVEANLINVPAELKANKSKSEIRNFIINRQKDSTKIHGWFYPLTRFDGYANVRYTKGVGRSEVIGSMLYTTVYNPDKDYSVNTNSCSAKIVGGSERQLYCLPYGVCLDATSTNGTGGFIPAGRGIQELTLGPLGSTTNKKNKTVLIGTQPIAEQAKTDNNVGYGEDSNKGTQVSDAQKAQGNNSITQVGGDGSAAIFLYNERYQIKPKTWYDIN